MSHTRPAPSCRLCGRSGVPLVKRTCSGCRPESKTRQKLSSVDAKLASWGDVEGQLSIEEIG